VSRPGCARASVHEAMGREALANRSSSARERNRERGRREERKEGRPHINASHMNAVYFRISRWDEEGGRKGKITAQAEGRRGKPPVLIIAFVLYSEKGKKGEKE